MTGNSVKLEFSGSIINLGIALPLYQKFNRTILLLNHEIGQHPGSNLFVG